MLKFVISKPNKHKHLAQNSQFQWFRITLQTYLRGHMWPINLHWILCQSLWSVDLGFPVKLIANFNATHMGPVNDLVMLVNISHWYSILAKTSNVRIMSIAICSCLHVWFNFSCQNHSPKFSPGHFTSLESGSNDSNLSTNPCSAKILF